MLDDTMPAHFAKQAAENGFYASLNDGEEAVVVVADGDVRLNMAAVHDGARRFLSQQSHDWRTVAEEVVSAAMHSAEKLSAPIVETRDENVKGRGILMTRTDRTLSLYDRLKLRALRESFVRSGVSVATGAGGNREVPLWVRDVYFLSKEIAYVPDAGGRQSVDLNVDANGDLFADRSVQETVARRMNGVADMLHHMGQKSLFMRKCYFEGGDLIPDFDHGYLFHGNRYQELTYDTLVMSRFSRMFEKLDYEVIPVRTDRQHYHLDIGLSPVLPDGTFLASSALGYESGYEQEGYATLSRMLGQKRLITISYADAMAFSANLTVVGNTLFMTSCSPVLRGTLEKRGFVVNAPPYNFADPSGHRRIGSRHHGGGVHCLTNEFSGGGVPQP